ncbi:hypothetical protein HOY80DRAFT_963804 [Tuber brumale]|nr:hypothetical protein HOY80DRAFT_963804 [Tuber brumale]
MHSDKRALAFACLYKVFGSSLFWCFVSIWGFRDWGMAKSSYGHGISLDLISRVYNFFSTGFYCWGMDIGVTGLMGIWGRGEVSAPVYV